MPDVNESPHPGPTEVGRSWNPIDMAIAAIAVLAMAGSAFWLGWTVRDRDVPKFSEVPPEDVEVLLDDLARVGVSCTDELDVGYAPDGSPLATCRAEPRFSLVIDPTVAESYLALDLALWAACLRLDAPPPDQWYLARRGTWSLLVFDRDQATAAGRLEGVTITVGTCDHPLGRPY